MPEQQEKRPKRLVHLKRPRKTDLLIQWTQDDVRRHVQWVESTLVRTTTGLVEWFAGLDGPQLLDVLHDCPHDMHELMALPSSTAKPDDEEEGREDDDVRHHGRSFHERRLKPIRQRLVNMLQSKLGAHQPLFPKKKLHKIMLERGLLRATWSAAARRSAAEDEGWHDDEGSDTPWDSTDPTSRHAAACLLNAYAGRGMKSLSGSIISSSDGTTPARDLTRVVDALRFALSPSAVAAAYAYEPSDSREQYSIEVGANSNASGKIVFQHATSNLASILVEVTRALWGSQKSILIVGDSDRKIDALGVSARSLLPGCGDGNANAVGGHVASESSSELVTELLRLLRSVLGALSALCPPKTALVSTGNNGIGENNLQSTAASGEARKKLEIVCNEALNPLVFLLAHLFGRHSTFASLRANIEATIRGPFAFLLYRLQWHDDNLVSLFATQKHMIVRAALHWLAPRNNNPSGSREAEQIVRRNLVTIIWSFAKKKERAAELATPEMLHPLLKCLDVTEEQRDVRFTAAGALEYLLRHRSSLSKMSMFDVGSSITGSRLPPSSNDSVSNHAEEPRVFDAVFDKLRPALSLLLGGQHDSATSSGYLQLTLAASANLAYLAITRNKDHPAQSRWLRDQLQERLRSLSELSEEHDSRDIEVDGFAEATRQIPELIEPRVKYEAMRLLWAMLRLRIHPQNKNGVAYRSLVNATCVLDVRCASAGVVFDNVPPHELKLHFIQDLLRYVCDDDHDTEGTESLRAFAAWILAHHTTRKLDRRHITSQGAFVDLGALVTDDNRSSLFKSVEAATMNCGRQSGFFNNTITPELEQKLLTMRLIAHCLSNLSRSELAATTVVDHSKLGQTGPLHALNRLACLGWCLEAATDSHLAGSQERDEEGTLYLATGEYLHRELASHETWTDDAGRRHHKCIPFVVRNNHSGTTQQSRVRQAATDERIHFVEPSKEYAICSSVLPCTINILDEASLALEHLAAHTQVRSFFATHGTLSVVVGLALQGRFSASVAFKVLLDTPRNMLVHQLAISRVFTRNDTSVACSARTSHQRAYVAHRPRWLIADINELILSTLDKAPKSRNSAASGDDCEAQVAALLALQLATSIFAQDDNKDKHLTSSHLNNAMRGKQVIVLEKSTCQLISGVCLKLLSYHDATCTTGIIDVILDSGEMLQSIPVKHAALSELLESSFPTLTPTISESSKSIQNDFVAYFVHPSKAGTTEDETSLFFYFVQESDRFFDTLLVCSENVVLSAASCNLCETLSNTLRRYLASGDLAVGEKMLARLRHFCGRQLARLVGDCVCDTCMNCNDSVNHIRGSDILTAEHGQLHICLYLLESSVRLYRTKHLATCSHRGFKFGIPTLMYNAISALHAHTFDAGLGELPRVAQRYVVDLCQRIQQPPTLASTVDLHQSDTDAELETSNDVSAPKAKNVHRTQLELTSIPAGEPLTEHDDDVRSGNNLLNSAFRMVHAVLEVARAIDHYRTTVLSASQPILLGEMLRSCSQKKFRMLETTHEDIEPVDTINNTHQMRAFRQIQQLGAPPAGVVSKSFKSDSTDKHEEHESLRELLYGAKGTKLIDAASQNRDHQWSLHVDEHPLYTKLRALCCQIVSLGVGIKTLRLDGEHYAQHSAIRSALRLLSALGSDHLLAGKVSHDAPTADKKFVRALVRCIKWHPYWHHWHMLRREQGRSHRSKSRSHDTVSSPRAMPLPGLHTMGDMLAVEACKLVQLLSTNLNQRHRMVFPEAPGKPYLGGRRLRARIHDSTGGVSINEIAEEQSDETQLQSEFENEINAAMKQRSKNGCLPVLTLLIGASRGDVDISVRSAAVAAVKEIAINSTICSEAICAHHGVKSLVVAAHVGDHSLRRNVAAIFSLIAMTPSIREELLNNYRALLLLLQLQALRDDVYLKDDNQVVASAGLALKYLSEEPSLVYLKALQLCVKRVEIWNFELMPKREKRRLSSATLGIQLLGQGYRELLSLALVGLDDAASHSETAGLLIEHEAIDALIECLRIREPAVMSPTARTLAALAYHVVAHEKHVNSSALICRVIDHLLLLIWPYAHRAARTLQNLCRQKAGNRQQRGSIESLEGILSTTVTLVPVSSSLVGIAASTIERAACDHGLGDYLVQRGAMEALVARLTPDGYKHDEDMSPPASNMPNGSLDEGQTGSSGEMLVKSKVVNLNDKTASLRSEPPVVQLLSAIAQLAHNAPHCLPSGKTERTLSIVCAFHHSARCRHLAMLALWRIRPSIDGGMTDIIPPGQNMLIATNNSLDPPPPIYWDDDDAVTWLGCIGFGALGKVMRKYLASSQSKSNIDILNSVSWTQTKQYGDGGWTRSKVEKIHDPYGQASAGEKLLALTNSDFAVGGRLGLTALQRTALELRAFRSELRELHLRMREFMQPRAYDVRLPLVLLCDSDFAGRACPASGWLRDTTVILTAAEVRRYHALFEEARDICQRADQGTGVIDLADLVQVAVKDAKQAYDNYENGNLLEARKHAKHAASNAEKVKDAVALHRVKLGTKKGDDKDRDLTALDEMVDLVLTDAFAAASGEFRWGDTLWYELSSAPTVEIFNNSRGTKTRDIEPWSMNDESMSKSTSKGDESGRSLMHRNSSTAGFSNEQLVENKPMDNEHGYRQRLLSSQYTSSMAAYADIEDICLWPTDGEGAEAAQVRELRRRKRTPVGLLQKVSKAPIRDARGLAHLYEVRFIDARLWTPDQKTALMMCAKEGDAVMVSLLLDNVESQLKGKAAMTSALGSNVYGSLPSAMRPSAVDGHGNTVLHHALFSLHRHLKSVVDKQNSAFEVAEHLNSRIIIVRTLLERVARPHGAEVFVHGFSRPMGEKMQNPLYDESRRDGAPRDALALCLRCYAMTQKHYSRTMEQVVCDERMPLSQGLSGLEAVAEKLDAIIKLMFECEFKLNSQAIRAAEEYPEVLARTRYLFVEHSRPSNALKHLLEEIPDIFLRRRFKSCVPSSYSLKSTKTSAEGSAAVFPKADKTPWEAPVFALKRLQQEVKKVWVERMIFTQNRQLLLHVAFLVVVLYVAAEIVGMDLCIVSRDALQQALRTRLVEEEWEPANGYMEIATPSNWWQWAEGPLLDAIYEPTLPTWDKKGKLKSSDDNVSSRFPLLGGLAFAVSQPRLRMFGTLPDEKHLGACSYKPGTQRLGRNGESCFSFFDANVELDEALEQDVPVSSATAAYAFDYKARAKGWLHVEAPVIYGHQAYYPGTGGYIAGFPKDPAAGEEMLHTLRNSSWLSQNTRAIVLEFMAFSASDHHSHNLLATVRLLAEFTPTGAVMCSGHIRAVRLWLYRTSRDFVRAVLEVVWVLAVCLQFRSEVRQLATAFQRDISANRRTSSGFLAQFYRVRRGIADYADVHFNLIDLGHFHVFIWLIAVHTLSLAYTAHVDWDDLFEADNTDRSTRRDLSTAAVAIQMAEIRLFLLGVYVMLSFLTLLDRMRVRESLHVLIIEEMFKKIFTFLIVMSVCVLGFSFTAFFSRLGGAQGPMGGRASGVSGGDVFLGAFISQMRQLIGEIDYEKAYNSDPRFGVVFCIISFMVLPVLLMNLLIAIMLEAYAAVKDYAAARFCYLQLVAYSDYTRSHDEYMGLVVHPGVTHWLALGVSATLYPLLVLERFLTSANQGARYVWRDLLHPTRRHHRHASLDSIGSCDTLRRGEHPTFLQSWLRAFRKLRSVQIATTAQVRPSPDGSPTMPR